MRVCGARKGFLKLLPATRPALSAISYDLLFVVQGLFVTKFLHEPSISRKSASMLDCEVVTDRSESSGLLDFDRGSFGDHEGEAGDVPVCRAHAAVARE